MDIEIISDDFRIHQANRYSLWLSFCNNNCSFVILEDATKTFVGLKRICNISLTKTIELFDELSAISFARVIIAIDSQPAILVPSSLYRQENARDLIGFSADFNEEHEVIEHYLPSISAVNLFAVVPSFKSFFSPYFRKATLVHSSSSMLTALAGLSKSAEKGVTMGIQVLENNVHLCLFDFGKLLFSNFFATKEGEDILYWALRICDQFSLHTHEVRLYLLGIENLMDAQSMTLKPYFPKLRLIPFPSAFQLVEELKSTSSDLFTELFYLPLCEL